MKAAVVRHPRVEAVVREPIFTRQEQGVVYLFSRYWDKIDKFKGKRVHNIHTHFPDFCVEDIETGAIEAIEFEYGLGGFCAHLHGDLKKLREDGIKLLYIVFWDEDADRDDILRRIRRHFTGKVEFVCLSRYFSPYIEPDSDCLRASWRFGPAKQLRETYSFSEIEARTKALLDSGSFERLSPDKKLYRTVGFNKDTSDFIECDHWKKIHFFTTNRYDADNIPSKLFVKLNRCRYFSGCFDVRYAFRINSGGAPVKKYFKDHYFYPYCPGYKDRICLVYSRFKELTYEQGVALYKYLKKKRYALQQASELISDADHLAEIGRIIGRK